MNAFPNLQGHQFMSLTTFRRNGTPVSTPVWFAQEQDHLYVYTAAESGKAKRLRHTARVTVAPCKANGELLGEVVEAHGVILPEADWAHADAVLNRKYGLIKQLLTGFQRLVRMFRGGSGPVYLMIREQA